MLLFHCLSLIHIYEERKKIVILDEITSLLSEKDLGEVFSLIDKKMCIRDRVPAVVASM